MAGKEVYRSVKLTDDVNPMGLGVLDQIRLIFRKASNDEQMELESEERLNVARLELLAGLNSLFSNAVEETKRRDKESVTLSVSSRFLPVLDEVIDSELGMGRFYLFDVYKPSVPINVDHTFIVKISIRDS